MGARSFIWSLVSVLEPICSDCSCLDRGERDEFDDRWVSWVRSSEKRHPLHNSKVETRVPPLENRLLASPRRAAVTSESSRPRDLHPINDHNPLRLDHNMMFNCLVLIIVGDSSVYIASEAPTWRLAAQLALELALVQRLLPQATTDSHVAEQLLW